MPRCFVMKRFVIVRQFLYDKLDSGGAIFSEVKPFIFAWSGFLQLRQVLLSRSYVGSIWCWLL